MYDAHILKCQDDLVHNISAFICYRDAIDANDDFFSFRYYVLRISARLSDKDDVLYILEFT